MILSENMTFYHVDGLVRMFRKGEEAPRDGWQDKPWDGVEMKPEPLDHDANGKKGGSLPKAKRK